MKTLRFLIPLMLMPAALLGTAGDVNIPYKNASDTAWVTNILAKTNNAVFSTSSSGVPQLTAVTGASMYLGTDSGGAFGVYALPSASSGANPSASVGLTAVNGSATTFLRSDGAPALDQSIAPTWTALHTWSGNGINGTSTDRILIENTSAATSGQAQWSPALHFLGHYFATSDKVNDWKAEIQTTNSAAGYLVWSNQLNGGGYNAMLSFGAVSSTQSVINGPSNAELSFNAGTAGLFSNDGSGFTVANSNTFTMGTFTGVIGAASGVMKVAGTPANTQVLYGLTSSTIGSNSAFTSDTSGNVSALSLAASATTNATTATTGALKSAGGLGVAKDVYSGAGLHSTGSATTSGATDTFIDYNSSTAGGRFIVNGPDGSTNATIQFISQRSNSSNSLLFQKFDIAGAATFLSSITTGAPASGTAAAWKLGLHGTTTGLTPSTTDYAQIDIAGTRYTLVLASTNP